MVTIYDVAKKCGVSIATVSYVLNNKNTVSEKTKEKVKRAAEEMGFIPNSLAQGLSSKKTNIMGLVVADILNTYTSTFIKHLEFYARKDDFYLLLGSTSNDAEAEAEIVGRFISKNVDSLVILPGIHYDEEKYLSIVNDIKKRHIPFVVVNMSFPRIKANYLVTDFEDGVYGITKYLIENGHKDIKFIGGSKSSYHSGLKYRGFLKAFEECGMTVGEDSYIEWGTDYTFKDGYDAINHYVKSGKKLPDSFVAVNDTVAQGIAKGLLENKIRIPEDVSLTGNDDINAPLTDLVPLTTLRSPVEELAKLCIEVLKESALNPKVTKQYLLNQEIVVRGSVKKMI